MNFFELPCQIIYQVQTLPSRRAITPLHKQQSQIFRNWIITWLHEEERFPNQIKHENGDTFSRPGIAKTKITQLIIVLWIFVKARLLSLNILKHEILKQFYHLLYFFNFFFKESVKLRRKKLNLPNAGYLFRYC